MAEGGSDDEGGSTSPKDIDQETYKRGIAQVNSPQTSQATGHATPANAKDDALQPASALGAFPLVRSTQASQLPGLVKGIYKQAALFGAIWSAVTVAFLPTLRAMGVVGSGALLTVFLFHNSIRKLQMHQEEEEDARFEARSQAIRDASLPESVEWLQALVESIWPRIPAETFASVADMLEDVIQSNLPSFLTEVKCAEVSQGKNALRILSSRLLPPTEEDVEEAKWDGGVKKHILLEVAFAYKSLGKRKALLGPTKEDATKIQSEGDLTETTKHGRQDARILFLFQAKLGPVAMQIPIQVLLNGLVGMAHIRLELSNQSPFLGEMSLSFVGLPRASLDIVPLKLSLAEVPGLSGLIQSSVDSALGMYTMPKELTMNLGELLVGDGIKRDCDASGIVLITIHSAQHLERSDVKGKGDPYARVNWTRTSIPNTRVTRVIKNELSPVWEQTFALIVSPQVIAALNSAGAGQEGGKGESISIEVYDSDTSSSDDFLGRSRWSLQDAMSSENVDKMIHREDSLLGLREEEKRGGTLAWSVGYFPKQSFDKRAVAEKGKSAEDGKTETEDESAASANDAEKNPPPSDGPSIGILSIQIHGIKSLRRKDATADEAMVEAPSSYVEVLLADRRVFRTRTKMDDGEPCFNAITEQVCDWRSATCVLVVRSNVIAGKDEILGVVPIRLSHVFLKSSLVTDVYPMAGGVGSGRLRVSLLFRTLQLSKEAPRLCAPVGVLVIHSLRINMNSEGAAKGLETTTAHLTTMNARANLSSDRFRQMDARSCEWEITNPVCLPMYRREAIALIIKLRSRSGAIHRSKTTAVGVLWLNQVADQKPAGKDSSQKLQFALWDSQNNKQRERKSLQRNWSSVKERSEDKVGLPLIGTIEIAVDFFVGVTRLHATANQLAGDANKVYEAWRAIADAGLGEESKSFQDASVNNRVQKGSSSSSSSSEEGDDGLDVLRKPLQESGSHGQLLNRFIRRGDYETTSLSGELKHNISHFKNKFRTDKDKTSGVETEV